MRASQYFLRTLARARGLCSGGKIVATASNSGPLIFPRIVQGAIRTCELFRMRLHLPESASLTT